MDTARARRYWSRHAPRYDTSISVFERLALEDGRLWACSHARGEVLEIAAGTGRNLAHYPRDLRLTATELSPEMLDIARRRAREIGSGAELRLADAQALEFPDERFDTVICTLGLCSIPDHVRAVREAARVLRPGGRLVLLEHVRSPNPRVRAVQRAFNKLSLRLCCDDLVREPLDPVRAAGMRVEHLERSKLGIVERLVAAKPAR